ncbi:TRAP transporter small permease subunit [Ectothiorhodospiraceae bacterium WFHF3C12]|nr:TRAP transporter small permease subunit [Ectothiorhodospiraceae bacterium WFHF3C12]
MSVTATRITQVRDRDEVPRFFSVYRWIDVNLERYLLIGFYGALALVIVGDILLRTLTGNQTHWGSTVSIYCFVWLSWVGCAYHVRLRTHLRFGAIRNAMPRIVQAGLYVMDDILWMILSTFIIYTAWSLIEQQLMLESVIQGTSIPSVFATFAIPVGWGLIVLRSIQDIVLVLIDYRRGNKLEPSHAMVD